MSSIPTNDHAGSQARLPDIVLTMFRGALIAQRADAEQRLAALDPTSGLQDAQIDRALEIIDACDDALRRIDRGTFGTCEICGNEVALARLEAIPHTATCVSCPPGLRTLPRVGPAPTALHDRLDDERRRRRRGRGAMRPVGR